MDAIARRNQTPDGLRVKAVKVAAAALCLSVLCLTGCGDHTKATKPTKAEWRAKLVKQYGQPAQLNVVNNWQATEFKRLMGEPDHTQTIGDQVMWYYECADGTIQLSMTGNVGSNIMQGEINDY